MNDNVKLFLEDITTNKIIKKYIHKKTWLSGSSTTVYPITYWKVSRQIIIQIETNKNIFKKLIEKYKNKYDQIEYSYFWKSDGSCPSKLVFQLK